MNNISEKIRVLFLSIAPPENNCGVRVVMHRHLVEREPFNLLVATNTDYIAESHQHLRLRLPYLPHRIRQSRLGPTLRRWIVDYENMVWPKGGNRQLEKTVEEFCPNVVLTLADNCLSEIASRLAERYEIPLAGLFLDWVPIMDGYYGHKWTSELLSQRFRQFYKSCDLAFCTSDGMQEVLGAHPNCHVIYPMPGKHRIPQNSWPPSNGKFRLVYVGSVENFYGRMICSLLELFKAHPRMEFIVVGPNADWPKEVLEQARANGTYLGFRPPEEAATILAGADALLVVMSFEEQYKLFMRTSFTTKFLDYVAFGKPVILWGPEYCTPVQVAKRRGGALVVDSPDASAIVAVCQRLANEPALRQQYSEGARQLHATLFNPDRLQNIFVTEIEKLVSARLPENGWRLN